MQCKKCGTEIKEECLFCHNCGEAVQMVPDYEPEMDDLQVKIASAQTKLPNKPTVKQLEETTEKGMKKLKKINWKLVFILVLVVSGAVVFTFSYRSVLKKQDPGAMQQTELPEPEKNQVYVSKPKFSRSGGMYTFYISVELSAETEGIIYYTLDGSTPNELSYQYTEPINLHEGTTVIRAFVIDVNGNSSDIVSEVYEVEFGEPDKPTIIPESGNYEGEYYVRILVPEKCHAYYTLDGTIPTEAAELYTGEFLMPEGTTTISAVVIDDQGVSSEISYVTYIRTNSIMAEQYQ